ncbi:MAG: PilZ domain-containing protein [Candidatus Omnitrophica bacterium]|nr:PilZ domain-containing protein [Candidatus Omnitrophota bacterium]MCM8827184.1 PilZ domain-containing protein [Candidatus Omnitrophota bacterium]
MKGINGIKYNGIERRRYPRFNVIASVICSLVDREDRLETTTADNISLGGICAIVSEEIVKANRLFLSILFPNGGGHIYTEARVVWAKEIPVYFDTKLNYEVGLEFVDISEEDRQKISRYIENNLTG